MSNNERICKMCGHLEGEDEQDTNYNDIKEKAQFPPITVGELRKALEGVPDNVEIHLDSHTLVGEGEEFEIVLTEANRLQAEYNGKKIDKLIMFIDYLWDEDGEPLYREE